MDLVFGVRYEGRKEGREKIISSLKSRSRLVD